MTNNFSVYPIKGIPEIVQGDDLTSIILEAVNKGPGLEAFDILVVTSKIISKAEGQFVHSSSREKIIEEETHYCRTRTNEDCRNQTRSNHGCRGCRCFQRTKRNDS